MDAQPERQLVDPGDLLGLVEMAQIYGKSSQYVWNRRQKRRIIMPIARVRATPLWHRPDVIAYIEQTEAEGPEKTARLERARTVAGPGLDAPARSSTPA